MVVGYWPDDFYGNCSFLLVWIGVLESWLEGNSGLRFGWGMWCLAWVCVLPGWFVLFSYFDSRVFFVLVC